MRTVVGVLRGGPGSEYDVSLKTGAAVLEHLDKEKYEPRDIFIDRAGDWHSRGVPMPAERALGGVDVAFNALHGDFGGGQVQQTLAGLGVPFTGSGALEAARSGSKSLARAAAIEAGAKVPYAAEIVVGDNSSRSAGRLFRTFPLPMTIISDGTGTVVGEYHALERTLEAAQSPKVWAEEYIPGRAAEVGIVDDFRGEKTYALIPMPGNFSRTQKEELLYTAKNIHGAMELAHYSLVRFVVTRRGIYFLEADPLPELHDDATMRVALAAVGAPMPHFLDHVIQLARND